MRGRFIPVVITCDWWRGAASLPWSGRRAPRTPSDAASAQRSKVAIWRGHPADLLIVSTLLVLITAVMTLALGLSTGSAAAQTPTTPVTVTVQIPGATRGPTPAFRRSALMPAAPAVR